MKLKSLIAGALAMALPFAASALTVEIDFSGGGFADDGGTPDFTFTSNVTSAPATLNVAGDGTTTGLIDLTDATFSGLFTGFGGNAFTLKVTAAPNEEPGFIEIRGTAGSVGQEFVTFTDLQGDGTEAGQEWYGLTLVTSDASGATSGDCIASPLVDADTCNRNSVTQDADQFGAVNPGDFVDQGFDGPTYDTTKGKDYAIGESLSLYLLWDEVFLAPDEGGCGTCDGTGDFILGFSGSEPVQGEVPLPAGVVLLLTGLAGFGFFRRSRAAA